MFMKLMTFIMFTGKQCGPEKMLDLSQINWVVLKCDSAAENLGTRAYHEAFYLEFHLWKEKIMFTSITCEYK